MASTFNHRSHHHPLEIMGGNEINVGEANCRACDLSFKSGDDLFGCRNCGFFLHRCCTLMRPSLSHPFHQKHQLELRYTSAYKHGSFGCDICGESGKGFNYHCKICEFDAHVSCVNLPLQGRRPNHKKHDLELLYRPPEGTSCRVCRREIQHCCYSCGRCSSSIFVHVGCSDKPRDGISAEEALRGVLMGVGVGYTIFKIAAGVHFLPDIDFGDFGDSGDFGDFGELPGLDGNVDGALHAEARSLAFEHMARMGI